MSTQTSYISAGPYHDIISGIQLIFSFSDGVVRLTGPEGTGKSSLLDALLDTLQEDHQLAMLFKLPPKSPLELHNHLTRELALPANLGFRKALARFITARPRDKQHLILLFDDADRMDEETLLDLMQLREVTNNGQPLVSIVLAGLPELSTHLAQPAVADLAKDIALSYEMDALDLKELEQFCSAAITALNLKIPRPTTRTLDYLLTETGGLPGRVLALLPDMVAEPEIAPTPAASADTTAAPSLEQRATAAPVPPRRPKTSLQDRLGSLTRLHLPFNANKLRQGLYGGAAIAATVAAVYLLYPQLAPLLQRQAPEPVASTPASAVSEPAATTAAPAPAPAPTAPAAETVSSPAEPAAAADTTAAVAVTDAAASNAPPASETSGDSEAAQVEAPVTPAAPAVATLTPPEPVVVTPPPASSAVSVVPLLPTPTLQDLTPEALEAVVRNWISAWQNQDLDSYFGAYHTDFAPLYQGTRAAWRANRSDSITRPSAISIALEDFTVNGESVVGTHESFWLEYHTATYAVRTLKELVIGHDLDGSMRILQEINRQVTTLTPAEFLSTPATTGIAAAPVPTPATPAPAAPEPAAPEPAATAAQTAPATSPTAVAGTTARTATTSRSRTAIGAPIVVSDAPTMDSAALTTAAAVPAELGNELRDFLGSWLLAWQQQDLAAYFRHYHPEFRASVFATREAWEADRRLKITRPLAIQIHLQNLQVQSASDSLGQVELLMEYHSSYYADRTRKALVLQRDESGSWQITTERNLQVEALPLARLVPGTTLTLRSGAIG